MSEQFQVAWMWQDQGESLVMAGRREEAIPIYLKALAAGAQGVTAGDTHLGLAIAYDAIGDGEKSELHMRKAREVAPQLTVSTLRQTSFYLDEDDKERWLATLERLGLPDQ